MMLRRLIFLMFFITGMVVLSLVNTGFPAAASSLNQQYFTPTAGPDGRIIYIVKAGENCTSISLKNSINQEQLRLLNDLKADCLLMEGQKLLLGIIQVVTPTAGMSPTPTPLLPTEQAAGIAEVCVLLFEDKNGNAMAEETELPLPGGAVSITDRIGKYTRSGMTPNDGSPACFKDVPYGDYNVSVAIPDGYNATTVVNYPLVVKAGDRALLDFGAQLKGNVPLPPVSGGGEPPPTQSSNSPLMAVLGAVLVLGGLGIGFYVWRHR